MRAELFLLAHKGDTGAAHLQEQTLTLGLAGAIVLELWLARRVEIGWAYDPRSGSWHRQPGCITVVDGRPTHDPLAANALAVVRRLPASAGPLRTWLGEIAADDLYGRVRAGLLGAGVLRRSHRRRYAVMRAETHTPSHPAYAIRAAARLSAAAQHRDRPDAQCTALCGLVDALRLAPYLYIADVTTAACAASSATKTQPSAR